MRLLTVLACLLTVSEQAQLLTMRFHANAEEKVNQKSKDDVSCVSMMFQFQFSIDSLTRQVKMDDDISVR